MTSTKIRPRSSLLDIFDPLENKPEDILARFDPLHSASDTPFDALKGLEIDADSDREGSDKENENVAPTTQSESKGKRGMGTVAPQPPRTPGGRASRKRRLVDVGDESLEEEQGTPPPKRAPFTELLTEDEPSPIKDRSSAPLTPRREGGLLAVAATPTQRKVTPLLVTLYSPEGKEEKLYDGLKLVDVPSPFFLAPPPPLEQREMPEDISPDGAATSFFLPLSSASSSSTSKLSPEHLGVADKSADISSLSINFGPAGEPSFNLLTDKLSFLNISADEIVMEKVLSKSIMDDVLPTVEETEDMMFEQARREVDQMKKEGTWSLGEKPSKRRRSLEEDGPSQDTTPPKPTKKKEDKSPLRSPAKSAKTATSSPRKSQTPSASATSSRPRPRPSSITPTAKPGPAASRRLSTISAATSSQAKATTSTEPKKPTPAPSRRLSTMPPPATQTKTDTSARRGSMLPPASTVPLTKAKLASTLSARASDILNKGTSSTHARTAASRSSTSAPAPRPSSTRSTPAAALARPTLAGRPSVGRPSAAGTRGAKP